MVGIAGKSKGCATCRRRKIRCDLKTPECHNCLYSGRTCEGYARYPVFLNRTAKGFDKRKHLEEVKSSPASSSNIPATSPVTAGAQTPSRSRSTRVLAASRREAIPGLALCDGTRMGKVVRSMPATCVKSFLLSWFWDSFAPPQHTPVSSSSSPSSRASSPSSTVRTSPIWLYHTLNIASPSPALQQALSAIALIRFGRSKDDTSLIQGGQRAYAQCLRTLQAALKSSIDVYKDDTLATVYLMILYEVAELTSDDISSWVAHTNGMAYLMATRGPQRHTTPLALAVLEETRYPIMTSFIMSRKAPVFGSKAWREGPWQGSRKCYIQRVIDHGYDLATLMARTKMGSEIRSVRHACNALLTCNRIYAQLVALDKEVLAEYPWLSGRSPESTPPPEFFAAAAQADEKESKGKQPEPSTPSSDHLVQQTRMHCMYANSLALQIRLATMARHFQAYLILHSPAAAEVSGMSVMPLDSTTNTRCTLDPWQKFAEEKFESAPESDVPTPNYNHPDNLSSADDEATVLARQTIALTQANIFYHPARTFRLARTTIDITQHFLTHMPSSTSAMQIASRLIFPLSIALQRVEGNDEEEQRCCDIFDNMASVQGLRFAAIIIKGRGGWPYRERILEQRRREAEAEQRSGVLADMDDELALTEM